MINGTLHCRTMALLVSRAVFCPTTRARPKGFVALRRELEVGRYRLVPPTSSRQTRIAATVAPLAFPLRREAYHPETLDIAGYTGPLLHAMFPSDRSRGRPCHL